MTQASDNNGTRIGGDGDGPGVQLRRVRETRGLQLRDIAQELHLDVWMLEALEADDFEALGAPVFAKGHMRQYATLLGLVPDDLMIAYYRVRGRNDTTPPPITTTMARQSNRRSVPWIGVLVAVAVIVVLAIIMWFVAGRTPAVTSTAPAVDTAGFGGNSATTETAGATIGTVAIPEVATDERQRTGDEPLTGMTGFESVALVAEDSTAELADVTPGTTATTAAPGVVDAAQTSAADTQETDDVGTRGLSPAASAPREFTTNRVVTPTKQRSGTDVQLQLTFAAESWVEILDNQGNRLVYTMIPAGRTRTVSGNGPLEVFLGNSRDVVIQVDGRPFTIPASSIRGNTARFLVTAPTS